MRQSTADHFNALARELQADPNALEKRFAADMQRVFAGSAPQPDEPLPWDDEESQP